MQLWRGSSRKPITHTLLTSLIALALGMVCIGCSTVRVEQRYEPPEQRDKLMTPPATSTPIIVDVVVPAGAPSGAATNVAPTPIEGTAAQAAALPPQPTQDIPTATPAEMPTPAPEVAPVTGQQVPVPKVGPDATTGLSATETFSDTAVPAPAEPVVLPEGTINIALLGVDTRPQMKMLNTDVIIIASINANVPAATLLSIPRDTLVYIPGWRSHKVNTAFARGGPDLFKQTIKYNFGINVDYYAMVDFTAVVRAVDTVGGVQIVATCPLFQQFPKDPYYMADPASPLTVTMPYTDTFTGEVWEPGMPVPLLTINIPRPGIYTLDGLRALAYVRARYGVPGGDIDRGRREQRLIRALFNKVKQLGMLVKVPELYAQFQQYVKTDLTLDNLLYLATLAPRFEDVIIRSRFIEGGGMRGATLPGVGSVLIPNRETMQPYIQQVLRVALNQRPNEGIPIEVWNATSDPDFGIVAADRLSELGFRILDIRNVEERVAATQIVDFTTTKKGSALPLLQRTFKIKDDLIISQPTPDGARYRIILGPDFNPCYYQARSPSEITPTPPPTTNPIPAAPTETPTPHP
ncbi:MAG: LCP family protein [Anaerolineae bacterium]|nr:LCP family protein [Thermoflexales bacterium]MDW8407731.1 LCP family protein [Anaerolineae bacterium]